MDKAPANLKALLRQIKKIIIVYLKNRKKPVTADQKPTDAPRFLQESPMTIQSAVKFGHVPIVNTLKTIVRMANSNLTIGLFGNWGSGKSSIVENLKAQLLQELVPVIIFDVWKHDGDALRRTFLQDLDIQLSAPPYGERYVKKTSALDQRVMNPVSYGTEKIEIRYKRLFWNLLMVFLVSLAVLGATALVTIYAQVIFDFNIVRLIQDSNGGKTIGAILTVGISGGLIFKYLDSFVKVEKTEQKKERLQDPHEFETEFRKLVANLRPEIPAIVIAFDNLDRVSGGYALAIISTIKTFLDHKDAGQGAKVIYLIPCDIVAIKKHIHHSLKVNEPNYVDEFLKKFFNTHVYIPEFYENELESFAIEKLKETNILEFQNEYIAWLIITAYHKNPRQIIQFINILTANYLLLKEYCLQKHIAEPDFYKTQVSQLTKFLLLKSRFPEVMERYQESAVYALENEEFIKTLEADPHIKEQVAAYQLLLYRTRLVDIPNLETFFKFRLSAAEQEAPELYQLIESILSGETALTLPQEYMLASHSDALSEMLRNKFRASSIAPVKFGMISACLTFSQQMHTELKHNLYREFLTYVTQHIGDYWMAIAPNLLEMRLIRKLDTLPKKDVQKILNTYINALSLSKMDDKKEFGGFLDFIKNFHMLLSKEQLKNFTAILRGQFSNRDVIERFLETKELQAVFITAEYRAQLLEKVPSGYPLWQRMFLLDQYLRIDLPTSETEQLFTMLDGDFNELTTPAGKGEQKLVADALKHVMLKYLSSLDEVFLDSLGQITARLARARHEPELVPLMLTATCVPAWKAGLQDVIRSNMDYAEESDLGLYLERPELLVNLDTKTLQHFVAATKRFTNIFNRILDIIPAEHHANLLYAELEANNSQYLKDIWQMSPSLQTDEAVELAAKLKNWLIGTHQTSLTMPNHLYLEVLTELSEKYQIPAGTEFIDYIFGLLRNAYSSAVFVAATHFLETAIGQVLLDNDDLAGRLIFLIADYGHYRAKSLYHLLFNKLLGDMEANRLTDLRDLIYQNHLHRLNDDLEMLESAAYATGFDPPDELKDVPFFIAEFCENAILYQDSGVWSYYRQIAGHILSYTRGYKSKPWKTIKAALQKMAGPE